MVYLVFLICTWRFVSTRGYVIFLTFDPGTSYFDNFFYLLQSHVANGTKFHIQPVGTEGNKCFSNGLCHMTNMATPPKYGKNL